MPDISIDVTNRSVILVTVIRRLLTRQSNAGLARPADQVDTDVPELARPVRARDLPKPVEVEDDEHAVAQAENAVLTQLAEGAADMDSGQAERIADMLLLRHQTGAVGLLKSGWWSGGESNP